MRLMLRRKRTWLLVLLGLAIVGAAAIWLVTSAKSDFERWFDQIKVGMSMQEVLAIKPSEHATLNVNWYRVQGKGPTGHVVWNDEGEEIALDFDDGRLASKGFTPLDARGRLRRLWVHCFKSEPPF